MVEYFLQGGTFMWPILAALILGIAFALERFYQLITNRADFDTLVTTVTEELNTNGVKAAITYCDSSKGPVRNLFLAALGRASFGANDAEKAMETRGALEMAYLEKNMSWVNFFIGVAPMLGFLGTVIGMIRAFDDIAAANDISPAVVAGGISVALLTTAMGLIVAVILQLLQNVVLILIEGHVLEMERGSGILLDNIKDLEQSGKLKA